MSFRRKNVVLGPPSGGFAASGGVAPRQEILHPLGLRPSPLDGRLTTSTGTLSLDQCLAGHSGLPVGSSILVEESGTTDFSGTLLKYYAAEGLVQGHHVHLLGPGEAWRGQLPGLAQDKSSSRPQDTSATDDKMKIAWRYEALNRSGDRQSSDSSNASSGNSNSSGPTFCHSFDLATRLDSKDVKGQLHTAPSPSPPGRVPTAGTKTATSPLQAFISSLSEKLRVFPAESIHRVVVPGILSPTLYGPGSCRPSEVIRFLHGLRGLLRQYGTRLTAVLSLSTTMFVRSSGLVRWMEIISDGVLEMVPLQQPVHTQPNTKREDAAQGMLSVHKLPVYNERGGGTEGKAAQENLSFKLSLSSGLVIKPFSLPPVGEVEGEQEKLKSEKKGEDLSF